ncbi:MAG: hypothetical protein HY722_08460 [Planctomycetes bacterium]|nr:hypothetical protein [Planctomycetota bacterium]
MKPRADPSPAAVQRRVERDPGLAPLGVRYGPGGQDPCRPCVLLVHGFAESAVLWTDPLREPIRTLFDGGRREGLPGGSLPFDYCVTTGQAPADGVFPPGGVAGGLSLAAPRRLSGTPVLPLWDRLGEAGYPRLAWDQTGPIGPIQAVVEEVRRLLALALDLFPDRPVAIVAHSRGGIAARLVLHAHPELAGGVTALVMLSTPNRGTRVATLAERVQRLGGLGLLGLGLVRSALVTTLLRSFMTDLYGEGLLELRPGAPFLRALQRIEADERRAGIPYYHAYGTSARVNRLYRPGPGQPRELLRLFDGLPRILLPLEWRDGEGDGIVAAQRAVLGFEREAVGYPVNHAEVVFDPTVASRVMDWLNAHCTRYGRGEPRSA